MNYLLLMLTELSTIFLIDITYYLLKYLLNTSHTNNTRWFYIHAVTNSLIVYKSFHDIKTCLMNPNICYQISWNENSYCVFYLSLLLHIYHLLFFQLNKADYIHHLSMCGICGPLIYYEKSILSSFSLFFLTGLPGMIDYFSLFLAKINKFKWVTQKKNYILLNIWIRSPGCILSTALSYPGLIDYYYSSKLKFLRLLLMSIIVFWNGQYYLMKTFDDYINYRIKNNRVP